MFGDKKNKIKDTERSLISETVSIEGTINSSGAIDVAGLIIGDTSNSRITIGVKTSDPNATVVVQPKTSTEVIQQWKDSTGRTVAYLDQNGNLHMDGDIIPF